MHTVTLTSDEALCGIKYKADADMKVLGRKLRNNIGRVKAGLEKLTSDDVKAYLANGKIDIDGIELVEGDLTVVRGVELPPHANDGSPHYETNTDNEVVVLLDVLVRPELEEEYIARELCNRVQRLRKKAGLVATDDIDVFYRFAEGLGAELDAIMGRQEKLLMSRLKALPKKDEERDVTLTVLVEEEQEIDESRITLTLVRSVSLSLA